MSRQLDFPYSDFTLLKIVSKYISKTLCVFFITYFYDRTFQKKIRLKFHSYVKPSKKDVRYESVYGNQFITLMVRFFFNTAPSPPIGYGTDPPHFIQDPSPLTTEHFRITSSIAREVPRDYVALHSSVLKVTARTKEIGGFTTVKFTRRIALLSLQYDISTYIIIIITHRSVCMASR